MRLELNIVNIKDIHFGEKTEISGRTIYVNRSELKELLEEDKRFSQVEVELAHPGEKCRILQVSDVIEPRAKSKGGEDFPGTIGKQGTAGEGTTYVLRGTAVVISDYSCTEALSRTASGDIIDMAEPAAEHSIYGKTHNIVVQPHLANRISVEDYRVALKIAGLKTAAYLAKASTGVEPDETEVYELPSLNEEITKGLEDLPKVVYIFQVFSTQFEPISGEPVLYGGSIDKIVPTIIHPNEVLDGAIINPYRGMWIDTYVIQNHPVIRELYLRHGKELCFGGVIITTAPNDEHEIERTATMAANLSKRVLCADGVVLTKCGGGAPEVGMARIAQRCEELGIKTALAMWEIAASASPESSALFASPDIDAMVSMGATMTPVTLPAVERIIGRPVSTPEGLPNTVGAEWELQWIKGAVNQLGTSRLIAVRS